MKRIWTAKCLLAVVVLSLVTSQTAQTQTINASPTVSPTCHKCKQKHPVVVMPPIQVTPAPIVVRLPTMRIRLDDAGPSSSGDVQVTILPPLIVRLDDAGRTNSGEVTLPPLIIKDPTLVMPETPIVGHTGQRCKAN
jgi:hypothetical protein